MVSFENEGWKANSTGTLFVHHYIVFLGGAFFNFNNVIFKKDFHNVFEYYDNPLQKEVTCWRKWFFDFILCVPKIYLFKNNACNIVCIYIYVFKK